MDWYHLLFILLVYFALGICSGFLSGLLGVGGGLITVPGLMLVFQWELINSDIAMHLAVATSLATMVPITYRSMRTHMTYDRTFIAIYKKMVPAVIAGVVMGVIFAHQLNSAVLQIIFGLFTFVLALFIFLQRDGMTQKELPGAVGMWLAGGFVGLQSGLLGVGGGSFTVPFLVRRGVDLRVALIVSIGVAMTVATLGTISYLVDGSGVHGLPPWTLSYIYLPAFIGLACGGLLMAPYGAKLSRAIPVKTLKICFGIFLLMVSAHMFYSVV